jgi:DNA-binding GntR family transcriptional regulator
MTAKQPVATSLTHEIYARLRASVINGRLRPGERLKINDLCQEFSGSLGAIREALSRLTSEGLVVAEPQRGFRVARISPADLDDLTMVRIEIEGLCLRRSIERGGLDWESRVVASFHRLSRTPLTTQAPPLRFSDAWLIAHTGFHETLASECDSPWLLKLRDMLFVQSERYRELCLSLDNSERDVEREHREIMDAALARDATLAVERMSAHLWKTATVIQSGINDNAVAQGPAAYPPSTKRPVFRPAFKI